MHAGEIAIPLRKAIDVEMSFRTLKSCSRPEVYMYKVLDSNSG